MEIELFCVDLYEFVCISQLRTYVLVFDVFLVENLKYCGGGIET